MRSYLLLFSPLSDLLDRALKLLPPKANSLL
jgi:hypothetical protein